ncbi:hypothetical protein SYNPS1DRAFT_30835 [Syncephalis pseudoplumigaleata]|uniref:Uncharacterized protein n=1 Tax=Syncephalis pseudoplumigaleata TaxID=1712513 RepID=A0A4V1J109_9FUNG|nr:hypothetical protein SYNPS1DRAFT_30835 [Syncephalis pseudoplumigaleata]|eukprot:RKP23419.1 hypothetical protein SYNPS1DRAFT_30835 [Syncephalis pseudoplumigaleata]
MLAHDQSAPRPSLVSICSSIAPKEQHCFYVEADSPQARSRLQRWAEQLPALPKKLGRRLQRSKSTNAAATGDAIRSPTSIAPPCEDIAESELEREDKFDLPAPQLDAFRMPVLLDAEFARITTGKSTASLTLKRRSTVKSVGAVDSQPSTPCSPRSASIFCTSPLPMTPATPTPTIASEMRVHSPVRTRTMPAVSYAQRAKVQSWHNGPVANISSQETLPGLLQRQQLEKKCSLRPRLISPASDIFLADSARCSSLTLLASAPSNGEMAPLEKADVLPSTPATMPQNIDAPHTSHKAQKKALITPLLRSSKARIMRVLSARSSYQGAPAKRDSDAAAAARMPGARPSLAATLNLSPRSSLSLGMQSSMERNCSGATAVSVESTDEQAAVALEMGLARCFKPVFELNQAQIDANERRRRQEHASALFDRLADERRGCFRGDEQAAEGKFEPATLRLTLTPSLVRGDEFAWHDDTLCGSTDDDGDDAVSALTADSSNPCASSLGSSSPRSLKKQRSLGSITRAPVRMLSKGSLRVSWIPEETGDDAQ